MAKKKNDELAQYPAHFREQWERGGSVIHAGQAYGEPETDEDHARLKPAVEAYERGQKQQEQAQ